MHRALRFTFVILLALAAATLAGSRAATPTGRITFTGWVVGPDTPFVPGAVVTVDGAVVARSKTCIEARVQRSEHPRDAVLWLCSPKEGAHPLPEVGAPVHARARITSLKATADGAVPASDSFVLLRAN